VNNPDLVMGHADRFRRLSGYHRRLLLWDLEHPERFYLIFTRPQWRSWLVKGAFIIAGYTLVLALHFIASWAGSISLQRWLMIREFRCRL
jgi:formate-dependent nitrite reductase membrane component NrfD